MSDLLLLTVVMLAVCLRIDIVLCAIICTTSIAQSLNQSYIRLTADRLSRRLASFSDAVLHPRALRHIYTSAGGYDILQINADQVVNQLSNTLGKLTEAAIFYQGCLLQNSLNARIVHCSFSCAYYSGLCHQGIYNV